MLGRVGQSGRYHLSLADTDAAISRFSGYFSICRTQTQLF